MPFTDDSPEVQRWVRFYRDLIAVHTSPAAVRAREIVFGPVHSEQPKRVRRRLFENDPYADVRKSFRSLPRAWKLAEFWAAYPDTPEVEIWRCLKIDRREWRRWRTGELPETSITAQRIDKRLSELLLAVKGGKS